MTSTEALINQRRETHGDWKEQATLSHDLKSMVHRSRQWNVMEKHQREALDMIMTKVSRICTGNPNEVDHWNDIAGYATLGKEGHR